MPSNPPPPPPHPLPPRLGPRPLPLHLAAASLAWMSSLAALPLLRSGSLSLKAELQTTARDLAADLAAVDPEAIAGAVAREGERRFAAFLTAIQTYRRHPFRPSRPTPPVLWQEGTTRLLDYRQGGQGPPVLVVPSLINRCSILDLVEERSFMRFLAAEGFRPFLVDWDRPGPAERGFDLSGYILGRLSRALDATRRACGGKPVLVGYCMGGLLALGLADRRPRSLAGLALLATPWDFHAERPEQGQLLAALLPALEPLLAAFGELPVDALQALFAALDPSLTLRKFLGFAGIDPASDRARQFVALEDWINDGVPLAAPVARECLGRWYGENATARGAWRLGDRAVLPQRIKLPSLAVIPDQDRIVPPASALALARALPGCTVLRPATGHIGMMSGSRAPEGVWRPLAQWIRRLPGLEESHSCTAAERPVKSAAIARHNPVRAKRRQP
jgi:polyhydroxyalkanoate synthase subunit PhaC